ncbi:hypothetical protein [Microbacterium trichothecenolyticum]|uniref:hypothetical protein n=1 Tax=Microbacterium trichothecenolyticum TaxID=69370 RepID=UPI0027D88BC5|nr:hypothetical protein [Microbacterium trichothecenolyticum]
MRITTLALATFAWGAVLASAPVAAHAASSPHIAVVATVPAASAGDVAPAMRPNDTAAVGGAIASSSAGRVTTGTDLSALADDSSRTEPDAAATAGRYAFVLIPLAAAVVIGIGAVVVIARGRRRRKGD